MGYALGARVTYPDRQVCVLLGDGAAGFEFGGPVGEAVGEVVAIEDGV